MRSAGPLEPLTDGGILHAAAGTLIEITIALIITVPLGLACAVYLNEVRGTFARFVRTIVEAMTALPSIVAGLFIYAAVILTFGVEKSGFAAGLALSVMMLPIIIRASDVVLRLVPGSLREASLAMGAGQWRTVCLARRAADCTVQSHYGGVARRRPGDRGDLPGADHCGLRVGAQPQPDGGLAGGHDDALSDAVTHADPAPTPSIPPVPSPEPTMTPPADPTPSPQPTPTPLPPTPDPSPPQP